MQSLFIAALVATGSVFPSLTSAFNASDIALATRENWCQHQTDQCGPLCALENMEAITNECFPDNLYYACVCDDGSRPNLTEYSETIPYYTCTIDQGDCIKACGSNECREQCKKTYVCGATNPKKGNATSSATASTAASTASKTNSATIGPDGYLTTSTSSPSDSAAVSMLVGLDSFYGLGMVAAGIAAGVALVGF